jgi:uncharacterized protein (TIGR02996 family)
MPDPALLAAIVADPVRESAWLALAGWFLDNGRDDEAAAVRVFWPGMSANLATGATLESSPEAVRWGAPRLGACAWEIEERGGSDG